MSSYSGLFKLRKYEFGTSCITVRASISRNASRFRMRTVVFVRHGEAGHNVIEEFVHRPDNPLTPHGRAQAQVVNTFLKESTIGQSDELTSPVPSKCPPPTMVTLLRQSHCCVV
jgi:hypothetical protein